MTRHMTLPKTILLSGLLISAPALFAQLPVPVSAILPGEAGAALLKQCSRGVPAAGSALWTPTPVDIVRLETALPTALHRERKLQDDPGVNGLSGWRRQYVGIVRKGRHYLYGNFFPAGTGGADEWRLQPIIVCDGGARFFGVEMDAKTGKITHLAFNGAR